MRRLWYGCVSLMIGFWLLSPLKGEAFPPPFDVCFQLSPFVDVLTLSVSQPDPTEVFFALAVVWNGADVYQLLGGGTAYGAERIGLHLTVSHETEFFENNPICHVHATVDAALNGPWAADCQGTSTPFLVAGTLSLVPCSASSVASDRTVLPLAGVAP